MTWRDFGRRTTVRAAATTLTAAAVLAAGGSLSAEGGQVARPPRAQLPSPHIVLCGREAGTVGVGGVAAARRRRRQRRGRRLDGHGRRDVRRRAVGPDAQQGHGHAQVPDREHQREGQREVVVAQQAADDAGARHRAQ